MSGRAADAPADTDLRELRDTFALQLHELFCDREQCFADAGEKWVKASDALLPLVRAQVEAARQDAWDEGFVVGYQKTPDESTPNPYRAARGETRQP